MSFSSFYISTSGMKATQNNMASISDNIANVNTDGFKSTRYQFSDLFSKITNSPLSQSVNLNEQGFGVSGHTDNMMTQGALQPSTSNKDMGIEGDGFFIVANGQATEYTRSGTFRPLPFDDKIVLGDSGTGLILQGWNATYPFDNEAPSIDTAQAPQNIEIGLGTLERGRASNHVTITGNLNANNDYDTQMNSISSIPLTNGTSPITAETDLKDVKDPSSISQNIFPDIDSQQGAITLKTTKGQTLIEETFVYGQDGTTVGDFLAWAQKALGIDASKNTDEAANSTTTTGITIDEMGIIHFNSGVGANQQIKNISLAYKNETFTSNLAQFTPELSEKTSEVMHQGMIVYDQAGNQHTLDIAFVKASADSESTTWTYQIESADNFQANGERVVASGTVQFDASGNLVNYNPNLITFNYIGDDNATHAQFLNLDLTQLTQLASNQTDLNVAADGFSKGILVDYYIGESGSVIGVFDNGNTEEIAKIALASFMNSENLTRSANGNWITHGETQEVTISESGQSKAGTIRSGAIEQSNVDLTKEFSKLIVAQRSFQFSSNALQVSNEILRNLARLGM